LFGTPHRGSLASPGIAEAGCAEVYPGPAALLCCFERSLLRNQRRRVLRRCSALDCSAKWKRYGCAENHFQEIDDERGRSGLPEGARGLKVLLVHPGGPFWRKKDGGARSIPRMKSMPRKIQSRPRGLSLPRSSARALRFGPLRALGRSDSEEGSASSHSPARAILTRRHSSAIPLISNGRPEAVDGRAFPNDRAEWFDTEFARTKGDIGRPERRRASSDRARHGDPWKRGHWRVGPPIPRHELVRLAGKSIYVLHDLKTLQADPGLGIDVIVSGDSHMPKIDTVGGVLYLNPGSAGPRRFRLPITLATLEVTPEGMRPEIHDLGGD
jgi:uncharacterized protein